MTGAVGGCVFSVACLFLEASLLAASTPLFLQAFHTIFQKNTVRYKMGTHIEVSKSQILGTSRLERLAQHDVAKSW